MFGSEWLLYHTQVVIHGSNVIKYKIFDHISAHTDETQGARNKDYKRYCKYHTRKTSLEKATGDVVQMLLVLSNPTFASFWLDKIN